MVELIFDKNIAFKNVIVYIKYNNICKKFQVPTAIFLNYIKINKFITLHLNI